ncbi:MAG: cell envelope-related transcriptional attenuator [Candidatus Wolfebacteria bacterium GW2011_GWC1_43_10]|uniref:Cell envelope-related transcriptional attenuator n=2 Tax=Candidatus Wolfeibacteriota TaxID=1752735 RepID=A0A0G1EJ20_9BACT|nr:MAG: cell envelope-related transcriptional attenuator [Candidatus Wolfebacteria bacterium GW2011_GWC1_43_10]KKT23083.1 MAG: Cell envelope-related transcriptional attenuator [Parcubacteria group bacterium GW2011_GWB1_43_8b]OGM89164.1 MAG: hypothetical protein A2108_01670 [Candidatus Wolfebacteria bacterium GWA1_42_9]
MRSLFKYIFLVISGLFILIAAYALVPKIPSRDLSWDSNPISQPGLESISDFFEDIFRQSQINILVFGRPGVEYQGGDLADALVLVHFDPDRNKTFLISLPRDLWISDKDEQFKINEAIYKKKIPSVLSEVKDITGLSADGYLIVDLKIVKEAVDFLGGVDIVLEETAVDWVSHFEMKAGPQHLNGEDAVWLIRNRYNREGDFFREKNQQAVIKSAFDKFIALSKEKKIDFFKEFILNPSILANAQIDMSLLTPYIFDSNLTEISLESVVLDFSTKLLKTGYISLPVGATTTNVSVLIPSAGFENYQEIKKYIQEKVK